MISIRFGLSLDGSGAQHLPSKVGDVDLGPSGLLGWLETHLGLGGIHPGATERGALYHAALREGLSDHRFYAASFGVDAIGTSVELLRWRDSLFLHGWGGRAHPSFGSRLQDLADTEVYLSPDAKCSVGDRLRAVSDALTRRCVPVSSIRVVESRAALPLAWQNILAQLPSIDEPAQDGGAEASMLSLLQRGLRDLLAGERLPTVHWVDDGSLRIVRGETRLTAARWAAESMRACDGATQLVLAESRSEVLDHALEAAGLARHGFSDSSAFRPTLQILPLALALMWEPLNIYAALEFLSHPVSPVPRFAREALADRLASRPGLQRADFVGVLDDIRNHYGDLGNEMVSRVDAWVFQPRYPAEEGAPITSISARVDALQRVFARRASKANAETRSALLAGHHQCDDVSRALRHLAASGAGNVGVMTLTKIVAQATTAESSNSLRYPELGCAAFAHTPGEVIDLFDRVTWWHLAAPPSRPQPPWTRAELRQLSEAGVRLPTAVSRQADETRTWLRPVFAARKELVLVLAPDSEEPHPILQMIRTVLPQAPIERIEDVIRRAAPALNSTAVAHRPLPPRRRWWTLPVDALVTAPGRVSFSSLDQYLNNPVQWVLGYKARLRPSRIRSIPDEFTLSGTVAHRIVQKLFETSMPLSLSKAALLAWTESTLEQVIRAEAAVFLLPGKRAAERRLRKAVIGAVSDLCGRIRVSGAVSVQPERWMQGAFRNRELVGSADLVLTFQTGEHAVVDLKWAGIKKYPEKLASNRHLQLMIYGGLLQQATNKWPRYAYYLLKDQRLLAHDREVFSTAHVCAPGEVQSLPELWRRIESTWDWRTALLDQGLIEIVTDDIAGDAVSMPPAGALELETLSSAYNPFINLLGWRD